MIIHYLRTDNRPEKEVKMKKSEIYSALDALKRMRVIYNLWIGNSKSVSALVWYSVFCSLQELAVCRIG